MNRDTLILIQQLREQANILGLFVVQNKPMTDQQKEIALRAIIEVVIDAATGKDKCEQSELNLLAESIAEAAMAGYKKLSSVD